MKITWKQQKDSEVIWEVFVHCIVLLELNPLYWRWSTSVRLVRWGLAGIEYKQTYLEICWSKPQAWYLLKEKQNSHTLDLIDSTENSLLCHHLCFLQMSSNTVSRLHFVLCLPVFSLEFQIQTTPKTQHKTCIKQRSSMRFPQLVSLRNWNIFLLSNNKPANSC